MADSRALHVLRWHYRKSVITLLCVRGGISFVLFTTCSPTLLARYVNVVYVTLMSNHLYRDPVFQSFAGRSDTAPCIHISSFLLQARSQRHRQTRGRCRRAGCGVVHRSRHRRCPSHTFTTSRFLEIHRGLCGPVRASRQLEALARARCQGKTAGR